MDITVEWNDGHANMFDGNWFCENSDLQAYLRAMFPPRPTPDMPYGELAAANKVAIEKQGSVTVNDYSVSKELEPKGKKGVIY